MKIFLKRALVVCGFLALAVPAWSYTILNPTLGDPAINVGGEDQFLVGATLADSGDATELNWVKGYLSGLGWTAEQLAALILNPNKNVFNFGPTIESASIIAAPLQYAPEYFFLKLGSGNLPAGAPDHLLFRNLTEFNYAVVDLADTEYTIVNIGGISHLGQVGGTGTTPVPEPGTMMLLGSGLVGLAAWGRKKFRK